MAEEPTTVLVADDHPVYREGVARAVRGCDGLELVGEAADGAQALAAIRRLAPAVAVLDLNMPGRDGLDIVRALRDEPSSTRVIILSAEHDEDVIFDLVSAGAAGYLSKSVTRSEICSSITAVGRGEAVFGSRAQSGLANAIRNRSVPLAVVLTPREKEMLEYIAAGHSAPSIGAQVHLSPATVKTHLGTLYQKLGVSDRAAAVAVAMRLGLVD